MHGCRLLPPSDQTEGVHQFLDLFDGGCICGPCSFSVLQHIGGQIVLPTRPTPQHYSSSNIRPHNLKTPSPPISQLLRNSVGYLHCLLRKRKMNATCHGDFAHMNLNCIGALHPKHNIVHSSSLSQTSDLRRHPEHIGCGASQRRGTMGTIRLTSGARGRQSWLCHAVTVLMSLFAFAVPLEAQKPAICNETIHFASDRRVCQRFESAATCPEPSTM